MQAGAVQFKLEADISNIIQQMQAAERLIKMTSTGIESAFAGIKSTALGIGASIAAGLGIGAFKSFLEGTIKAGAGLHDLAIIGNTTVEALSGMASIGKYSDTGADAIVASMNKLTKNLTSATEESAGTGKAIQALGLDMKTFASLSPEDQMMAVAKAMDGFQDGAGKSAVAMALYGKEGAKLLPFMKDLAAAHELEYKLTTEQAAAADNLDDNLTRIQVSSDAWKKTLVNGMVPALDEAAQAYLDVMNGTGGLNSEIKKLAADGSIANWTRSAIVGLTYVADGVAVVWRGLRTLAIGMVGYLEMAQQALAGNFSEAKGTYARLNEELSDMWSEQTMGQRLRARLEEVQNLTKAADTLKPKLDVANMGRTDKATGRAAIDEYAKLIEQINEKIAVSRAEQEQDKSLTEGQKLQIKIMEQFRTGKLSLAEATERGIPPLLQTMLLQEQLANQHKLQVKADEDSKKAHDTYLAGLDTEVGKLQEQIEQQRLHNDQIGLSKDLIDALAAAKMDDKAATLERMATLAAQDGLNDREVESLTKQAKLWRELAELKRQEGQKQVAVEEAKNATAAWTKFYDSVYNGLTDSLYRAFEKGHGFFQSLWDGIKNMFKTTVLKLMIQGVVGSILSGVGLPGAANAQGTGAGSLSNLWTMGKSLANGFKDGLSWLTNFGGKATDLITDTGWKLFNGGLKDIGGTLIENAGTIGSSLNTMGEGLGYLNAVLAASKGKWGEALGSAIGTYFGGPIGAFIGAKVGGWIDTAFGGPTKPSIEGGFSSSGNPGTNGRAYTAGADGMYYGGALDTGARAMITGTESDYNRIVKASGYTGGTLTGQAFMGIDGNNGSKGSQNKLDYAAFLNGNQIYNRGVDLGTNNAGNTQESMTSASKEANTKAILAALAATDLGPALNKYLDAVKINGASLEEVTASLADVTNHITLSNAVKNMPFEYLKNMSVEASKAMIGAAGGLEQLGTNIGNYFDLFGTEAEKQTALTGNVSDGFKAIGIVMPTASAGLRDWYNAEVARLGAMDLSIQANADAYNSALLLASGVNTLAAAQEAATATRQSWQDQLDVLTGKTTDTEQQLKRDLASTTDESTKAIIRQVYAEKARKKTIDDTSVALEKTRADAIAAAKSQFDRAIAAERTRAQLLADIATESVSNLNDLFAVLKSNTADLYSQVSSTAGASASAAQQFISDALVTANRTGYLPDKTALADAITSARAGIDSAQYATKADADFAKLVLAGQLDQLKAKTGNQLSIAEQQLKVAKDQIQYLDSTAKYMQDLIDATNGVDKSIIGVGEAITAFLQALTPGTSTGSTKAAGTGGGSTGGFVTGGSGAPPGGVASGGFFNRVNGINGAYNVAITDPGQIDRLSTIRDAAYTIGVDPSGLASAAIAGGVSMTELATALNVPIEDARAWFAAAGIPAFAVGTNYVPRDMLAQIHEGEAIVPKAYNPAAGGASSDGRLIGAVQEMTALINRLLVATDQNNAYAAKTAQAFGNGPLLVETV